jgi:2-polyprenyl-6-methoxyphenol hydroxylase-like FAD-dependent oxidoreductase
MTEATSGGPREQTLVLSEVDGELTVVRTQAPGRARPGRQVDRRLLRAILLTGLQDVVRFGAGFTRFDQQADGTVRAWFADGSVDTADVLVGADGIGSAVRRQYMPHVQVVDTGKRMLMGATPLRAVAGTGLPGLIGDSATSVQAGGTMMALGVLRSRQPPVAAREQWLPAMPSRAVVDAEDYVMWAVPITQERLGPAGSPATVWRRAQALAVDLHPALRLVVDEAWPDVTVALRIALIPPMPPWPAGPVTLIGDAIHLAPGFGANLAMQDAHRLCDALVQAFRGEQDLPASIGAAEDTMRLNNFPVAEPAV